MRTIKITRMEDVRAGDDVTLTRDGITVSGTLESSGTSLRPDANWHMYFVGVGTDPGRARLHLARMPRGVRRAVRWPVPRPCRPWPGHGADDPVLIHPTTEGAHPMPTLTKRVSALVETLSDLEALVQAAQAQGAPSRATVLVEIDESISDRVVIEWSEGEL